MNSQEHRDNVLNAGYSGGIWCCKRGAKRQDTETRGGYVWCATEPAVAGSMTGSFMQAPIGTGSIMARTGYLPAVSKPSCFSFVSLLLITALVAL